MCEMTYACLYVFICRTFLLFAPVGLKVSRSSSPTTTRRWCCSTLSCGLISLTGKYTRKMLKISYSNRPNKKIYLFLIMLVLLCIKIK